MESDNIFFIDTPVEIQDEYFYEIIEKLKPFDIPDNFFIYLQFSSIFNIPNKFFFKVFITSLDKFEYNFKEPDFLIFFS